jgi:hypothetical protein
MNLEIIKAYKSNDGCIWETEKEAINQNICEVIDLTDIKNGDSYSTIRDKLKLWFKDHPKAIRYVLANINKIDL